MTTAVNLVEPASRTKSSAGSDRGAAVFVWGIWALMLMGALVFISKYAGHVPFWDDWNLVPVLTGNQHLTAAWLWEPINEHRIPLPKLVLIALYKLTHYDFRAGVFFNALSLGGLAFAMILTAQRLRGWIDYSDAFFPLALLHWGQYENLLISITIVFVLATVLAGILLLILVQGRTRVRLITAALFGLCLVALSLCGANGVALVPALALWLGYTGVRHGRAPEPHARRNGLLIGGLAAGALLLVALYFVGFRIPSHMYHPSVMTPWDYAQTSVQFLTVSFGPAVQPFWPFSGLAMLGLLLLSVAVLVWSGWKQPQERLRAFGILLFIGAVCSLAAGLGWGRAAGGPAVGLQSRYSTLAAPLLCGIYFVWTIFGPPAVGHFARMGLFTAACALCVLNAQKGLEQARPHRQQMDAFEQDLRAGKPIYLLLKRHSPFLFFSLDERLGEGMRMLHRAGIGLFRFLQADPPFQEVPLPVVPHELSQMTWENGIGEGAGPDPSVVFALPAPQFVAGIRITYAYPQAERSPLYFQMFWKRSDQSSFRADQRYLNRFLERSSEEKTVTIWLAETIDQFRIHPDNAASLFKISQIVLLLPATNDPPRRGGGF